jgi:hypothetical protein
MGERLFLFASSLIFSKKSTSPRAKFLRFCQATESYGYFLNFWSFCLAPIPNTRSPVATSAPRKALLVAFEAAIHRAGEITVPSHIT